MKTPKAILEEYAGKFFCVRGRAYITEKGEETQQKEYIDQALSALRECVLAKKKEVGEMRYGGCNPDEDRGYNLGVQDIANLFGGEK